MRVMIGVALSFCGLVAAGCSVLPDISFPDLGALGPRYVKEGASDEEFQRTYAACQDRAAFLPQRSSVSAFENPNDPYVAGRGLGDTLENIAGREQFLTNCMRVTGWVREN